VFKVGQEVTVIAAGRSAMFRNYHQARNLFNSTGLLQDKLFRFADVGLQECYKPPNSARRAAQDLSR